MVIELLPAFGAEGQIADQADGAVSRAFSDVANLAVGMGWALEGAGRGWLDGVREANGELGALGAGMGADLLMTLTLGLKAVGDEGIGRRNA